MSSINLPVRLLDLSPTELTDFVEALGVPKSAVGLLGRYLYREAACSFEEMTELPPALRSKLSEQTVLGALEPIDEIISADGQTRKVLFRLEDGKTIESTLMFFRNPGTGRARRTVCVSTQVGCALGCPYCATGRQGFERNLSPGEIVGQVIYFAQRFGADDPERETGKSRNWVTHVVFMGMGEPLTNYDNVVKAVAILNWQQGMGLGFHQVTVSTAGLAPQIIRLAGEGLQFQLAVSLHAATDKLRDRLVPVNRKYPLSVLIPACREYAATTGRKVFIEYALFDGVNDSLDQVDELLHLLEGLDCSINLIVGNPTCAESFQPSSRETALAFQKRLITGGIRTMLRVSRGADIEAGCGQLRSRWLNA
ncbi:23S rRNA (adenine(2503)-C(2))-methyltransferase RlmN [Dehalogenimonas sp. THU2]|uniref:23S rRNA (adenine(2503)-C(2))-methyltransferase RlmN n=1 Tax=Dehalogenimonas sp. THU2 TaxID=3151121 RepID=UPI0032185DBD